VEKIYVGNLPYSTDDEQLRSLFETFGEVTYAKVIMDRETNRSRGFGFVEMASGPASIAIQKMNGHEVKGRLLRVNKAQAREPRERNR